MAAKLAIRANHLAPATVARVVALVGHVGRRALGGTVVVFTHGGCIRLGTAEVVGLPVMGDMALGPVATALNGLPRVRSLT